MPEGPAESNGQTTMKLFLVIAAIVIATRLPFLDSEYSQGVGETIASTRFAPGCSLQTGIFPLLPKGGSLAVNGSSALLTGIAIGFFALFFRTAGGKDYALAGLALAFTPIIFLNSIAPGKLPWILAFLMGGLFCASRQLALASGICSGLTIGCGISYWAMIIPISLVLFHPGVQKNNTSTILRFALPACLIGGASYLLCSLTSGWRWGLFEPLSGSLKSSIKMLITDAWGAPGTVGMLVALTSLMVRKPGPEHSSSFSQTSDKWFIVASATALTICMINYFTLPAKGAFIAMALPFVIILLARFLDRRMLIALCCLLLVSPFILTVTLSSKQTAFFSKCSTVVRVLNHPLYIDFLRGPILLTYEEQRSTHLMEETRRPTANSQESKPSSMWITAYYPTWSLGSDGLGVNTMAPSDLNWHGLTHLVHFGANVTTVQPYFRPLVNPADSMGLINGGDLVWPNNSWNVPDSLRKYADIYNVKLLLSCGGIYGDGAKAMSYILSDSTRTQVFVNALLPFAERHHYDGIEVDWEPVYGFEPEDQIRTKMSLLTRILHRGLNKWTPRGLLVFAATDPYRHDVAYKDSIDQMNPMQYDMHQSPGSRGYDVTGFNAPLHSPDGSAYPILWQTQSTYDGVYGGVYHHEGIKAWLEQGWPANKIGLGIPLYGYIYNGPSAPEQPRNNSSPQYITYRTVERASLLGGTKHWEDSAKVPWIGGIATTNIGWYVSAGQAFYITYDDTTSLREKVRWAKNLGLGGIMVYELWHGWDNSKPIGKKDGLLRAIVDEVNKP
jgi:GH18 family chitinase